MSASNPTDAVTTLADACRTLLDGGILGDLGGVDKVWCSACNDSGAVVIYLHGPEIHAAVACTCRAGERYAGSHLKRPFRKFNPSGDIRVTASTRAGREAEFVNAPKKSYEFDADAWLAGDR